MMEFIPLAVLGLVGAAWLAVITLGRPRWILYATFALTPTQWLFLPVSDFFLSTGDVLVTACAFGLVLRLATVQRACWQALYQHRFLVLMVVSYLAGFAILGIYTRTIVRVPIGITLSILACELLRTRTQLLRAATMIVVAGMLDAAYGLFFIARGTPLYASRFSGMSPVNFAAMLIFTSTAIGLALLARTRRPAKLWRMGALGAVGLATLSHMGVLALLGAWLTVLRRIVSRANKIRIATAVVLLVTIAFAVTPVRERLLGRTTRQFQADGVTRSSYDIRWMLLRTTWSAFLASPVIGIGYFKFEEFSNTDPEIYASTSGAGYPTHNTFLEVLVEGGIVAFTCFVLHWWQYFRRIPRAIRMAARSRDALVAACLVGFPVMMICAALANILLVYSFWAVCGLALACLNLLGREEIERRVLETANSQAGQ